MQLAGVEPSANLRIPADNQQNRKPGAAKASVARFQPVTADAELLTVVKNWPALPAALKAGILAMVRASKGVER